ncbi:MAG: InlB B-repeat-containing protein, partial [Alphaproteobacteria bacterium]|nr:InlB B-repeat-containing protein [Alphaproteobacteria bacterium]
MGKFLTYMLAVIVIFLGLSNIAFCVSWIFDRSGVIGNPNQLEKEFAENSQGYTITYNLDDGTLEKDNPKEYGLFTATFTLNNPTKDGYKFLGWTGSNGETPQTKITICTGSCGDLEFNANFALILGTPEVTLEQNIVSWNSV